MIEFISGILIDKNPSSVVIDTGGLGYKVTISLNTFNELPKLNQKISLITHFNVTEKSQDLYGFIDKVEKKLFRMLISVSGIGPKIAINLLSFIQPEDFKQRIIKGEVQPLTSLPGIGPKTAKRIIIELKDKLTDSNKEELPIEGDSKVNSDAYYALINLGYKPNDVRLTLNNIYDNSDDITVEYQIKEALKILK